MSRKKRKFDCPIPAIVGSLETRLPALKKQPRYGSSPWNPGEIPTRTGSLMPITEPIEVPVNSAYGEFLGIEAPPVRRGSGWPAKSEQHK